MQPFHCLFVVDVPRVRNNLWDWQDLSPTTGPGATFFKFCDALEVKEGTIAGPNGWGLDHALAAWGSYWNATYYKRRKFDIIECSFIMIH